jgi:hypothetical protein
MDDEMWELFREIKNEEDKQNKISNGIDDNGAGEDIIKCECGSIVYIIEYYIHICILNLIQFYKFYKFNYHFHIIS